MTWSFSVSATPSSSLPKRPREEEDDNTVENSEQIPEEMVDMPLTKKLRSVQRVGPEVCEDENNTDDFFVFGDPYPN